MRSIKIKNKRAEKKKNAKIYDKDECRKKAGQKELKKIIKSRRGSERKESIQAKSQKQQRMKYKGKGELMQKRNRQPHLEKNNEGRAERQSEHDKDDGQYKKREIAVEKRSERKT